MKKNRKGLYYIVINVDYEDGVGATNRGSLLVMDEWGGELRNYTTFARGADSFYYYHLAYSLYYLGYMFVCSQPSNKIVLVANTDINPESDIPMDVYHVSMDTMKQAGVYAKRRKHGAFLDTEKAHALCISLQEGVSFNEAHKRVLEIQDALWRSL